MRATMLVMLSLLFFMFFTQSSGFQPHSHLMTRRQPTLTVNMLSDELTTGELENIQITRLSGVLAESSDIQRYRIDATLKSKQLNEILEEYKGELKARKISFPGFRPGKIPPFAMTDVRRYIVCYGLETTIGNICNMNGLIMCTEAGGDVPFGEDGYYQQIVQKDFRGYDFNQQRDTWKEGTDLSFIVEFFAKQEKAESDLPFAKSNGMNNVVDAEIVNVGKE